MEVAGLTWRATEMPIARRYRIPARMPTKSVVARLGADPEPPSALRRTFLDTADWLLYGAKRTLEADESGGAVTITLRQRDNEEQAATASLARLPEYAGDLPADGVWSRAAAIIGDRRLLPMVQFDARLQRVPILDQEHKTTARVLLERYIVEDGASRRRMIRAATVVPVKGYERSADRTARTLEQAGLAAYDLPLLSWVARLLRMPEPGSDVGPGVSLDRSMPAAEAMAALLGRLRHHVQSNEDGVRRQLDLEFLHDYRVAVRRTRSLLRCAKGALPERATDALATELKWLADLTGPVRDLDVHIAELSTGADAEADADADADDDLAPLRRYLRARHSVALAVLLAALDSERYRQLLTTWEQLEKSQAPSSEPAPDAATPAGRFSDARIGQAYRRVLKRGRAIDEATPPEDLHDLRKRAKELRYLLECFQTLYPGEQRTAVVRELKAVQDNLGEFQDCQVQAATLRAMAEDLMHSQSAPASTLMAMGRLADEQERREAQARADFDRRFKRFASKANQEVMAALLGGSGPDAPEPQ